MASFNKDTIRQVLRQSGLANTPSRAKKSNSIFKMKAGFGRDKDGHGLTQHIVDGILDQVDVYNIINPEHMQRYLYNVISKSYGQALKYAQKNMLGTDGARSKNFTTTGMANFSRIGSVFEAPGKVTGSVNWKPLSKRTIAKKGHSTFFRGKGLLPGITSKTKKGLDLAQFLSQSAEQIIARTGVVKLEVQNKGLRDKKGHFMRPEKITIGHLNVRIMPKIPVGMIPGMAGGDIGQVDKSQAFERRILGNFPDQLRKLKGPGRGPEKQRPMLQPVFNFWSNYYIPTAIRKALLGVIDR